MSTRPTDTTYTVYNMANILCQLTYDEDFYILIQVQRSICDFRVNGYFPAVYNFCMENGVSLGVDVPRLNSDPEETGSLIMNVDGVVTIF